jgi:hypothetical protein
VEEILLNNLKEIDIPLLITDSKGSLLFANNLALSLFNIDNEKKHNTFHKNISFYNENDEKIKF